MSDYGRDCCFDPAERIGESACPFNQLLMTFLHEFAGHFTSNRRMTLMLKNAQKIGAKQMSQMVRQRTQFIDMHIRGNVRRR